jgi:hypothetical protein
MLNDFFFFFFFFFSSRLHLRRSATARFFSVPEPFQRDGFLAGKLHDEVQLAAHRLDMAGEGRKQQVSLTPNLNHGLTGVARCSRDLACGVPRPFNRRGPRPQRQ